MTKEMMEQFCKKILAAGSVEASAPCRIDMGGTLDISTFYYPLRYLLPCTFNIAMDLRTKVRLLPYEKGMIKVSSKGFKTAKYPIDQTPFNHPLGLVFAIAVYFWAGGVHIIIDSSSPPRSALGGSSAAAVALIGAFLSLCDNINKKPVSKRSIAILAHKLEASVAGVPCGLQDQLAATFGGVNAWFWDGDMKGTVFKKKMIVKKSSFGKLEKNLLLAYCGVPHESRDINGKWVRHFLSGKNREFWSEIALLTGKFVDALSDNDIKGAAKWMNMELAIRRKMTPEVLDKIGEKLAEAAHGQGCGARFTGAGGGGCIWALGETEDIDNLKVIWDGILSTRKEAVLLDIKIDSNGLTVGEHQPAVVN